MDIQNEKFEHGISLLYRFQFSDKYFKMSYTRDMFGINHSIQASASAPLRALRLLLIHVASACHALLRSKFLPAFATAMHRSSVAATERPP